MNLNDLFSQILKAQGMDVKKSAEITPQNSGEKQERYETPPLKQVGTVGNISQPIQTTSVENKLFDDDEDSEKQNQRQKEQQNQIKLYQAQINSEEFNQVKL